MPLNVRLREGEQPPDPREHPNYLFKQLNKIYSLRGQIAANRFVLSVKAFILEHPHLSRVSRQQAVHEDETLQDVLRQSAIAFTQAVAYAQLFAPGSVQLSMAYDVLYEFLKNLNRQELADFYRYEQAAPIAFRVSEMKPENFGDMVEFLRDCFGDYYEVTDTDVPV